MHDVLAERRSRRRPGGAGAPAAPGTEPIAGDDVARELDGLTLDDVFARVAREIGEDEPMLRARYWEMSPGACRSTLADRLRRHRRSKAASGGAAHPDALLDLLHETLRASGEGAFTRADGRIVDRRTGMALVYRERGACWGVVHDAFRAGAGERTLQRFVFRSDSFAETLAIWLHLARAR